MGHLGAAELLILGIPLLIIYFVPSIIGFSRGHTNSAAIFILNLLFGWTFVGWIAVFVWSLTSTGKQTIIVKNNFVTSQENTPTPDSTKEAKKPDDTYFDRIERLQKLKQLLDSGVLTQEEFISEKNRILQDQ